MKGLVVAENTRIYEVKEGDKIRLVDAPNDGKALLHVLRPEIQVSIPSTRRVAELMAKGIQLETAEGKPRKAKPEAQQVSPAPTK